MTKKKLYMYDVRGIQSYIFRTNKIKEIIGASSIVEELIIKLFDDACKKFELKVENDTHNEKLHFSFDENEELDAEILYYGGGNLLVLYKNSDVGERVSKEMRKNLLKKTYSLQLAVASVDVGGKDTYKEDYETLRKNMDKVKAKMPMSLPVSSFPITSNDPVTGFPFSKIYNGEKVTCETYYKLKRYDEILSSKSNKFSEFGSHDGDSLIAIVHIDGNNMGKYIREKTKDIKTYHDAAKIYRGISNDIQNIFSNKALKAVEDNLENFFENHKSIDKNTIDVTKEFRTIIHAGDDITFICNAKIAMDCVREFMKVLEEDKTYTACAGIYVTHSHFPFSRGYEFAEELCSNAKRLSRIEEGNYVDFHINTSGILNDIDYIRRIHYMDLQGKSLYARPYSISLNNDMNIKQNVMNIKQLMDILKKLKCSNIARSQLKGLREAFYQGEIIVSEELNRINSRLKDEQKVNFKKDEYIILFDAIEILDLEWGDVND